MAEMTISLPEETLNRVQQAANVRQKSASAVVEEAINAYLPKLTGPSLAEVLHDYIGAAGHGQPTDSSKMSDVFGDILEQKHREGRL